MNLTESEALNMTFPYGRNIKLYIEGGSHDKKMQLLIKGFPKGKKIDFNELKAFMNLRRPGLYPWTSKRAEADEVHFLSGFDGCISNGSDILAEVYNTDIDSAVYSETNRVPRPSHADYPAVMKYGETVDLRGGGHFSGRLTCLMCAAGGLFIQLLKEKNIYIAAHIYSINTINDFPFNPVSVGKKEAELLSQLPFPVLDSLAAEKMQKLIFDAARQGDSIGGIIECAVSGIKAGAGEHMFAGAEGRLAAAVFSIPAVKGVEFGSGFSGTLLKGSENNDAFYFDGTQVRTKTNNCGGILGGMTNGMPVIFKAAVKPTPSISKEQDSVDLKLKKNVKLRINGRHDPCIVPRAVPAVRAMAAAAVYDMLSDGEK